MEFCRIDPWKLDGAVRRVVRLAGGGGGGRPGLHGHAGRVACRLQERRRVGDGFTQVGLQSSLCVRFGIKLLTNEKVEAFINS
jgi:hypothetical protein